MRITTGVMAEATGNVASHTAKAAAEEGSAQAFTYEADKSRSSGWRAGGELAATSTMRPVTSVSGGSADTLAAEFP